MENIETKKKVFVALSGGVDSAVSAALLKEQGYDVTGVYMKNWSGDDFGIQAECPWETDQKDAENVCKTLDIPFRSFNFEKQYREKVVEYFFSEYKKGRTPNPDVMCNKEIKFKLFLERALEEGADFIATGHYARVLRQAVPTGRQAQDDKQQAPLAVGKVQDDKNITYHLLKGIDDKKNQVYFIYNLTQEQLSHVLFPVGDIEKTEVRKIAERFKLPNAKKPDSQGICFIGEIDVLKFLMSTIPERKGEIRDIDTEKVVGEHKGIYFYTIGQREGLHIGGQEIPYYVCGKDELKNILYVCHGADHSALLKSVVELESFHWINEEMRNEILDMRSNTKDFTHNSKHQTQNSQLTAMIRYQQKPQPGKLEIPEQVREDNGEVHVDNIVAKFIFDKPMRAVASGQSLVIFNGEECLGGGIIK